MLTLFHQGGPFMWLLLIFSIIIIFLTVKKSIQFFGKSELNPFQLGKGLNAILFWGCMSALLGFYAHYLALYMSMQAIVSATEISPFVVAEGYGISLITVMIGLLIHFISTIIWFVLKWRYNQLIQGKEK